MSRYKCSESRIETSRQIFLLCKRAMRCILWGGFFSVCAELEKDKHSIFG